MQRFQILATSLLASACTLTAAAQTPATAITPGNLASNLTTLNPQTVSPFAPLSQNSHANTFSLSPSKPNAANSFTFIFPQRNIKPLDLPQSSQSLTLDAEVKPDELAQLAASKLRSPLVTRDTGPCYALRVYGFTPQDVKSPHPHASTETDCTPASTSHVKTLQLPATIKVK